MMVTADFMFTPFNPQNTPVYFGLKVAFLLIFILTSVSTMVMIILKTLNSKTLVK